MALDKAYWQKLAQDYLEAFKRVTGNAKPTKRAILFVATPGEFETQNGRAWESQGKGFNIGAVQGRELTEEEMRRYLSGELKPGTRIPGYVLQEDSNPNRGNARYPMWFVSFDSRVDAIAHYLRVLLRPHARKVIDDPHGTLRDLAQAMYLQGYYEGRHAGARYFAKRTLPLTAPEQANVNDYTKGLERNYAIIASNMGPFVPEEEAMPSTPAPSKPARKPTAFGRKVAEIALAHQPCSAHINQDIYIDVVVRPSDRGPAKKGETLGLAYYTGHQPPSTCGLFAGGCMRKAGLDDPELVAPYKTPPGAVVDIQRVASRHKINEAGTPSEPFIAGDIVIINEVFVRHDAQGNRITSDNPHVIVCVGDTEVSADGKTWTVDTVQGGQVDPNDRTGGSSAVKRIKSTFTRKADGKWYGGSRYVMCTIRCSRLDGVADEPKPTPPPEPTPTTVEAPSSVEEPAQPTIEPSTPTTSNDEASTDGGRSGSPLVWGLVLLGGVVAATVAWLVERC